MPGYFQVIREIYKLSASQLEDMQGIHVETLVGALSAVCGELLLRACKIDFSKFPPGGVILSDQLADSAPRLLGYLEQLLGQMEIDPGEDWSGLIPVGHQPSQEPLTLAKMLRADFNRLQKKYKMDESTAAHAACMAMAIVIRDTRQIVPPKASVAVACNYLMRAAKSVPLE